ncbi:AAA family ATPase [Haliangium sp.]|uniref:AAA family ATPase n=1 Tax=Haliangium sp. TaxID=2663208 RepID=UPI003D0AA9BB
MSVRGMVLGKFMPPHLGHVHLVDFARAYCDEVAVVVEKVVDEPIPSELRLAWMQEMFPDCHLVHLVDLNPQEPAAHPRFWDIWRDSLRRALPWPPDVVLASEDYGPRLAEVLGARFVPVDRDRRALTVGDGPLSGTAVRADPMGWFDALPRVVRPYFVKRVRIVGPESSGKSTLARALARRFDTVWVPEYAETVIRLHDGRIDEADLVEFVRGQVADEQALARSARRVLICDTDAVTTLVWSRLLYGRVAPALAAAVEAAAARPYELTLLCLPDVPFAPDVHRVGPDTRARTLDLLRDELGARGVDAVELSGDAAAREARAAAAIAPLLGPGG